MTIGGSADLNFNLLFAVSVCFIAAVLCGLLVPVFADAGELFRYRLKKVIHIAA
jgi:hypothetical protein